MWKKCYKLSITYINGVTIFYDNMMYKKGLKCLKIRKLDEKKYYSISLENIEEIKCCDNVG